MADFSRIRAWRWLHTVTAEMILLPRDRRWGYKVKVRIIGAPVPIQIHEIMPFGESCRIEAARHGDYAAGQRAQRRLSLAELEMWPNTVLSEQGSSLNSTDLRRLGSPAKDSRRYHYRRCLAHAESRVVQRKTGPPHTESSSSMRNGILLPAGARHR